MLHDYLKNHLNKNTSSYKKWSDVLSDHFFSFTIPEKQIPQKIQKRIHRKQIDELGETGNQLVFLSSKFYFLERDQVIPLFLTPIRSQWNQVSKQIEWNIVSSIFETNPDIFIEKKELELVELEEWLLHNFKFSAGILCPSLYFNTNTRKHIIKDLKSINLMSESSQAMTDLFHEDIRVQSTINSPDFLSKKHFFSIDSSQACAIEHALDKSIVISGPPGTGKTQTILNIALEEITKNKKVAILSEKQAALDVLEKRVYSIGFHDLLFSISPFSKDQLAIEQIENSLESILQSTKIPIPEFNITIFNHEIRLLEDFYNARAKQHNLMKEVRLSESFNNEIFQNPLLKILNPSNQLIGMDIQKFEANVIVLSKYLIEYQYDFNDLKLIELFGLNRIQNLMTIISSREYEFWRVNKKKGKSRYRALMKQYLKIESKLANYSKLGSPIFKSEVDYLLHFYKNSNFLSRLLDANAKKMESKLIVIDEKWKMKSDSNKIEFLENLSVKINLENQLEQINSDIDSIIIEHNWANKVSIFEYLDDKFHIGSRFWNFVAENSFYETSRKKMDTWNKIRSQLIILKELESSLKDINVYSFIEICTEINSKVMDLKQSDWDKLCTNLNDASIQNSDYFQEPVLKNYSIREIIRFKQDIQSKYEHFCKYSAAKWYNSYQIEKNAMLNSLMQSRKKEESEKKLNWKKSIQFIQKNWSKKRKKLSSYQYLNELDLEFMLWFKPLFIMNLEQFSQYTPLKNNLFDTIIIDESSQVELLHALPALFRAKKIIIVGDDKQLTPTKFFRNLSKESQFSNESLLEYSLQKLSSIRLINHYRSKFKELIEFSNYNFYGNTLNTTYKSAKNAFEHFYIESGIYHERRNTKEAEALIDYMIENIHVWNDQSIGIICFSIQQKEEIETVLESKICLHPRLASFISEKEKMTDYFFIKNIENVQGDERDVVLISLGYGKNKYGKLYQFFGPILQYQGENRLNVLMSRSKEKLVLFSSIKSNDIVLKENSSKGLRLLKQLLGMQFIESKSLIKRSSARNYWEYFLDPKY